MITMIKKLLTFVALSAATIFTANAQTTVFEGDNSDEIPYRIPAIVQTSNEDILVFADKRHDGGDVGQNGSNASRIDVVYKRFSSNTWGNETTVKTGTSSFGYGDVAVVADRENPAEIVFFTAAGNTFFTKGQVKCFRFRSSDGGVTWDKDATTGEVGTEVTNAIYKTTLGEKYTAAFFSSGRICQSSKIKVGTHYRLYAALCVTGTNSIVVYSDDFGDSWYQLGGVAAAGGDEAKCVELPNGNVLVSSKGKSTRYYNVFKYNSFPTAPNVADGSWTGNGTNTSAVSGCTTSDAQGTNGELLLVQASKNGKNCYLVMQTVPAESSSAKTRKKVTLYWKELDTTDLDDASQFSGAWTNTKSLSTTTSSYSTMIQLADGTIAFAYEENYTSFAPWLNLSGAVWDSYDIQYKNLNISDIATGYTLPVIAAPVISPAGGEVEKGTQVEITGPTGATIYYTTDGNDPTTSSAEYNGPITVDSDMTIKAIAVKRAWTNSTVSTATFTVKAAAPVEKVVSPTFSIADDEVEEGTAVTITCATDGATIYYTTDGNEPTTSSAVYSGAIIVNSAMTIKAFAAKDGYTDSEVVSATFTIKAREVVATPVLNPAGGEVEEGTTVTISCATDGATIYYTTDGNDPTTASAVYGGAIVVDKDMTIKAFAAKDGYYTNSAVATATFTIKEVVVEPEVTEYPVTPVSGRIGGTTYYLATFSANENTVAPAGVSVFYVRTVSSDEVALSRVSSGKTIPAGKGVILMASSDSEFNMTSTTDESNVADLSDNCLAATGDDVDFTFNDENCYALAVKGSGELAGQFAFCKVAAGTTLNGYNNRAYLDLSASGASFSNNVRVSFDGVTGIESSVEEFQEQVIYDICGRRVHEMKPGNIYIVNGRKVLKK